MFKSKTGRSKINGDRDKFTVPPVGLYEHKFGLNKHLDEGNKDP